MAAWHIVCFQYAVFITLFFTISSKTVLDTSDCKFAELTKFKSDPCLESDLVSAGTDTCKALKELTDIICKDEQLRSRSYNILELINKNSTAFCDDVRDTVKNYPEVPGLMKDIGWCKYFCHATKNDKIICAQLLSGIKILQIPKDEKANTDSTKLQKDADKTDDKTSVTANKESTGEKEDDGGHVQSATSSKAEDAASKSNPAQSSTIVEENSNDKPNSNTKNVGAKGNDNLTTKKPDDEKTEPKEQTNSDVTATKEKNAATEKINDVTPKLSEENGDKDKSPKPSEGENESEGENTGTNENTKSQDKLEVDTMTPTDEQQPDDTSDQLDLPDQAKTDGASQTKNEDDDADYTPTKSKEKSVALMPEAGGFPEYTESHFFVYFVTAVVLCIILYLGFHNKQKIVALIIEGRQERRRRSNVNYKKLDSNLDEVLHSSGGKGSTMTPSHIIY